MLSLLKLFFCKTRVSDGKVVDLDNGFAIGIHEGIGNYISIWAVADLFLSALCALGGRFAGSESEAAALGLLGTRLGDIGGPVVSHPVEYPGWQRGASGLEMDGGQQTVTSCSRTGTEGVGPHTGHIILSDRP